jgi:hypothetical protein
MEEFTGPVSYITESLNYKGFIFQTLRDLYLFTERRVGNKFSETEVNSETS